MLYIIAVNFLIQSTAYSTIFSVFLIKAPLLLLSYAQNEFISIWFLSRFEIAVNFSINSPLFFGNQLYYNQNSPENKKYSLKYSREGRRREGNLKPKPIECFVFLEAMWSVKDEAFNYTLVDVVCSTLKKRLFLEYKTPQIIQCIHPLLPTSFNPPSCTNFPQGRILTLWIMIDKFKSEIALFCAI